MRWQRTDPWGAASTETGPTFPCFGRCPLLDRFRQSRHFGAKASGAAAGQPGRTAPRTRPQRPHSWREVLKHTWENIGRHRVLAIAAGGTFYAILAIFPAIATIVTLYGLFADPSTIAGQLNALSGVLPGGALQVIGDEVTRVSSGPPSSLSITLQSSHLVVERHEGNL